MLNPQPRATAKPDQDRLDESVSEALREASVKAELVRSLDAGHCTLIPPRAASRRQQMDRQQAAIAVVTWPRRLVGCARWRAHAYRAVTFASIGGFCRTLNLKRPRPAARHRLPAIYGLRAVTAEGGPDVLRRRSSRPIPTSGGRTSPGRLGGRFSTSMITPHPNSDAR
jgi:hypothetical protein